MTTSEGATPDGRTQPRSMQSRSRHAHAPAVGADPVAAAFERGVAAYNADDVDAAADAFEEAVRLAPDEAEAHINLGLVYLRLERPDDAKRELEIGEVLAVKQERR